MLFVVSLIPYLATAADNASSLVVEADESLQWLQNDQQYIAIGNAVASKDDMIFRASKITADYIDDNSSTAAESATGTTITRMLGEGNSHFTRGETNSRAEIIDYDMVADIITMKGSRIEVVSPQVKINAAESLVYQRPKRLVTARGKAKVLMEDGRSIHGDTIIATLSEDESEVLTINAKGDVLVESAAPDNRSATANKADYDIRSGLALLEGDVTLFDGQSRLSGEKARMDTASGVSTLISPTKGKRVTGVIAGN